MTVHRLPDLARVRAFAERFTAEGAWFLVDGLAYVDASTRTRASKCLTGKLPRGTVAALLAEKPGGDVR